MSATTHPQIVQRANGSTLMAAAIQPEVFMLATLQGTLVRSSRGCLGITDGQTMHVVQFPYGTTLAEDGNSINIPEAGIIHLGDKVTGGGGFGLPDQPGDLPTECSDATGILYWQSA